SADAKHLHHRMLLLGHSHARAVLILYTWTALIAFGSVMLLLMPALLVIAILGTLFAIPLVFTFYPLRIRRHAREEIS
ncbi:undecaprenyl/decaprenyl-phosphate alpha-N-acetylglucosaminyl 1-phosphate transferase, partial [Burkholderia multivorans]